MRVLTHTAAAVAVALVITSIDGTGQRRPVVDVRGVVVGLEPTVEGQEAGRRLEGFQPDSNDPEPDHVHAPIASDRAAAATLGDVWDQAYGLQYESGSSTRKSGVRYAEPVVSHDASQREELTNRECPPCLPLPAAATSCNEPIPGALKDPLWSLDAEHGANVLNAHALFRKAAAAAATTPGQAPKDPGSGATIGHPDTGYTEHPEIWPSVDAQSGWNFLTDDDGPLDPLLSGTLRNPGHGTKTASVIVSPADSQLGASKWVTGVAPGAALLPLRVAEGVALFPNDLGTLRVNAARLADAIRAASGPNRQKVKKKADVISISMGGIPGTRDLADAVAYAEQQGVIVIAAAGNQVPSRRVVFPAAFDSVIAVAATNYNSRPWNCTSRGTRVLISAPGESVWTASSPPFQRCVEASTGTSFATATLAGVAALWVSYPEPAHQKEIARLRAAQALPRAFKQVLAGAFRRVDDWDGSKFGPGIVDAVKVLQADLRNIDGVSTEAFREPWCAANPGAFAGLEGIFADADDPKQRIAALFGTENFCEIAVVADEVVMLTSVNDRVNEAVSAIAVERPPSRRDYDRARRAIREADISSRLRSLLAAMR